MKKKKKPQTTQINEPTNHQTSLCIVRNEERSENIDYVEMMDVKYVFSINYICFIV